MKVESREGTLSIKEIINELGFDFTNYSKEAEYRILD